MNEPIAEKEGFYICPMCGQKVALSAWLSGYSVVEGYHSEIRPFLCMDCFSRTKPNERYKLIAEMEREQRER